MMSHFNVSPAYGMCSLKRSQLGPGVNDVQPDFKSVILKQFVASSPTFPFRTTLEMNGESIGEIRFKAISGDILNLIYELPLELKPDQ